MKKRIASGASLALAVACVGCGGSSSGPSSAPVTKAADQAGGDSSIVRVAEGVAPTTLDPQASSLGADWRAWQLSYECLLTQTGAGKVVPQLATKYSIGKGGRQYIFDLRHGVSFHNGDHFTSADVVYTFKRLAKSGDPYAQSRFPSVASVKANGTYRVSFTLEQRDPSFLLNMSDPSVVGCAILNRRANTKPALKMIGTGPYAMTNYEPHQELGVRAYDKYWGPKPENDGLDVLYVPDALTQRADLDSGKVDLIFPDTSLISALEKDSNAKLDSVVSELIEELDINTSVKPFDNVRVRQAIALAVDRAAIATVAFNGAAVPSSYLPPSLAGAVGLDQMPYSTRDVPQAKKLLAEAGYPNGFDTSLMYVAGYSAQSAREAALLQSQLGEAGIRVKLDPLEQAAWNEKLNKPDYQLAWNFYGTFADPYQYLRPRPGRQGSTPASLQTLIDKLQTTTPSTYMSVVNDIAREEANIVFPDIALVTQKAYVAYRPSLQGVSLPPSLVRTFLKDISAG